MRIPHETTRFSNLRTVAAAAGVALLLTACGGDTPETLRSALSAAASSLDYVDASEQDCVAAAVLDQIGFDQLVASGVDSETLTGTPELITDLVLAEDNAALRTDVADCVDSDRLFRDALSATTADELTCDTRFDATESVVDRWVADTVAGTATDLAIDDSPANRDLVRPCLTEADFARMFDLDLPESLAMAVTTELPDYLAENLPEPRCFGEEVVGEFGVERLNELGVRVDSPGLDLPGLGLEDAEVESILGLADRCGILRQTLEAEFRQWEPAFADCVLERVGDEYFEATLRAELGDDSGMRDARIEKLDALGDCAEERRHGLFGPLDRDEDFEARSIARFLRSEIEGVDEESLEYAYTPASYACAAHGLVAEHGSAAIWDGFDVLYSNVDFTPAVLDAFHLIVDGMLANLQSCLDDWLLLTNDLHRAGFGTETLDCVHGRVADDVDFAADAMVNMFDPDDVELTNVTVAETFFADLFDALELCHTEHERAIFEDYDDWLNSTVDLFADTNDPAAVI